MKKMQIIGKVTKLDFNKQGVQHPNNCLNYEPDRNLRTEQPEKSFFYYYHYLYISR